MIERRLRQLREQNEWNRANPVNPVCLGCDRRDAVANLTHEIWVGGEPALVCAECADDALQSATGCRYGIETGCGHADCAV